MQQWTIYSKMMRNVLKESKNKRNRSSCSNNNFNKRKIKLHWVEEEELHKVHISKKHLSLSSNSIIKKNINSNRNTNQNISQRGLLLNKKILAKNHLIVEEELQIVGMIVVVVVIEVAVTTTIIIIVEEVEVELIAMTSRGRIMIATLTIHLATH